MSVAVRFQETLRRLAAIDEGFVEDGPGSRLARPRHRPLDPRTAALLQAGCRWRSGRRRCAGSLILVAGWDRLPADDWPERVRATAVSALGVLKELREHGADVRARDQVEVEAAAESASAGFPSLPA
jgi:hypothetical protein